MRKLLLFLGFLIAPLAHAQGTFTAATCNRADVNAVINGPTHTARDGDTIQIPAGSCAWTSTGVTVPPNIGITIIGSGSPASAANAFGADASCSATTITWTVSSGNMLSFNPQFGNSTTRLSCMAILTTGPSCGGGCSFIISVNGACSGSGCPNVRIDNLTTTNGSICNVSDSGFTAVSNMFGVLDHNTIGTFPPPCNGPVLVNVGHGSWKGVGSWGDKSWADADSFGTNQALFLENNHIISGLLTDTDIPGGNGGGARIACRFNNTDNINSGGGCTGHGTDTTGRARGVRQFEVYWNTGVCSSTTTGCGSFAPGRSGVGRSFANTFSNNPSTAFFKGIANFDTQRRWRPDSPWGGCDGSGAFDTNDGVNYFPGTGTSTMTSVVNTGNPVITDIGTPGWTTNQWVPPPPTYPFSMHDIVANGGFLIGASSANTLTGNTNINGSAGAYAPTNGHTYQILRASVCIDQGNRSGGNLVQDSGGSPVLAGTGNPGPVNQVLDPTYEADDALGTHADHTISSNDRGMIANRDIYVEGVNQTAQTTATSPFNGTSGTGHGTLALRPTCVSPTCLTGVGYWATNQGTWNTFDSTKEGVLYIWNGSSWVLSYTPFTYPHPLTSSVPAPAISFSPQPLAFGNVLVNTTSSVQLLTISNPGTATLTITSLNSSGAFPFQTLSGTCGGTPINISAGGSCTTGIVFTPGTVGPFSQNNTTTDNAAGSPHNIALTGTGVGGQAATPTFSPVAGSYVSPQIVSITSITSGATICYTIDGTVPTANGAGVCTHGTTLSNGATIIVSFTQLVQAIASKSGGFTDSTVGIAQYTLPTSGTGMMVAWVL